MKKTVLGILVLVFVLAALVLLFSQRSGQRSRLPQTGDPAPEFQLTTLDGRNVSLSGLRGKVVMVHFWATWCPPCVEELPTLDLLARSIAGSGFEVLAISVDEGGPDAVREFMTKNKLSLPVLLDQDKAVAGRYGTFKFPETYIVDRQGIIRNKIIGAVDWGRPEAREIVEGLLKKQ
jgi:peroxiredoxin